MQAPLYLEDDVSILLGFCMGVSAFLPEGEGISDPSVLVFQGINLEAFSFMDL